ncbi:MAG: tRNA cyclic N6-threonylcarbamoyladenosine(37) synthase TcdA, partial [Verrucomicrobiota bacterium]
RDEHGFPRDPKKSFGVDCVYSPEPPVYPKSDGAVCARNEEGNSLRMNCESGYGAASFVTGAFGFAAAAVAVRKVAGEGE